MSAWLLVLFGWGGALTPIVVTSLESEAECHRLAAIIVRDSPRGYLSSRAQHRCFEYFVAVKP